MRDYDVSEELVALLSDLAESKAAVIVEGRKDKAALVKIGIYNNSIFVLNTKPLFSVAEEVAANFEKAAILTDLDAEGKKLYGKLNTLLQRLGVKVDNSIRNFLFKNTKLRQIEGIANIIRQQ